MSGMSEQQLAELAAYHVGLFAGVASRDAHPAAVAHALWLLAQEAERRRAEWLASARGETP